MERPNRKKVSFCNNSSFINATDAQLLNNSKAVTNTSYIENNFFNSIIQQNKEAKDTSDDEIKPKNFNITKDLASENSDLLKSSMTDSEFNHKRLSYLMPSFLTADTVRDEVEVLLNEKEQAKVKEFTRREITKKKKPVTNTKKDTYFNPKIVTDLIDQESKSSDYGLYFKYLKYLDVIISISVCMNIGVALIDNSIYVDQSSKFLDKYVNDSGISKLNVTILSMIGDRELSDSENSLRSINIFIVIAIEFFLIISYIISLKLLKAASKISKYDSIFSSGLYKKLIIEVIIMGLFVPPNFNKVVSGSMDNIIFVYDFSSLITYLIILKSYVILRVYTYFSYWTSSLAKSVCQKYKIEAGIHFAVKAELKKRPYTMLTIMMVISLCILGYGTRTFEYGTIDESTEIQKGNSIQNDLMYLKNCFWLIIVTMTTVGYGDMAPKSHFGRVLSVIGCIIGMLLVSLIVVSLTIISQFSPEEKKAYSFIKKLHASDTAHCKAANVIIKLLYVRRSFLKGTGKIQNSMAERFVFVLQLKKDLTVFKNDYKLANNYALPIDEMLKNLETKLKEDMDTLLRNIKKLETQNDSLDIIYKEQTQIQEKMSNIVKMQEAIGKFVVKLNNEAYKKILHRKLIGNETS